MVTIPQIRMGIMRYIQTDMLPKLSGLRKAGLAVAKDKLRNMAKTMLDKARREGHPHIDMLDEMWAAMVERQEDELCRVKTKMDQAKK